MWLVRSTEPSTAVTVKTLQERVISASSVPKVIIPYNAKRFTYHEFKLFCFGLGIKHVNNTCSLLILSGSTKLYG